MDLNANSFDGWDTMPNTAKQARRDAFLQIAQGFVTNAGEGEFVDSLDNKLEGVDSTAGVIIHGVDASGGGNGGTNAG